MVLLGVAVPSVSLFCYVLSFNWVRAQSAASVLTLHMVLLSFFPYIIVLGLPASAFTVPHAVLCCLDPPYALLAGLHFLAAYTSPVPPNPFLDPEVVGSDSAVVEYFASHKEAYPVLVAILGLAASALGLLLRLWQLQREREASSGLESGAGDLAAMMGPQTEDGDDEVLNERDRVQHSAAAWDAQSSSVGAAEGDLILCSSLGKVGCGQQPKQQGPGVRFLVASIEGRLPGHAPRSLVFPYRVFIVDAAGKKMPCVPISLPCSLAAEPWCHLWSLRDWAGAWQLGAEESLAWSAQRRGSFAAPDMALPAWRMDSCHKALRHLMSDFTATCSRSRHA